MFRKRVIPLINGEVKEVYVMYIIVCKDDLGGWIECGRYDDQDDAIEARDSLQVIDPNHTYKIMTTE